MCLVARVPPPARGAGTWERNPPALNSSSSICITTLSTYARSDTAYGVARDSIHSDTHTVLVAQVTVAELLIEPIRAIVRGRFAIRVPRRPAQSPYLVTGHARNIQYLAKAPRPDSCVLAWLR